MASSSTSRSLFLLSLLLVSTSGFGMTTATASVRSLLETSNKLAVGGLLDLLLLREHGLLHLVVAVDVDLSALHSLVHPVELLLVGASGEHELVELKAVECVLTELKEPILVKVSVSGTVSLVVKVLGKKVRVALQLSKLEPVVEHVVDLVHVVLKLVGKVEKGLPVLQIVDPVTKEVLAVVPV